MSDYFITTTNEPEDLANVLLQALGEKGKAIILSNDLLSFLLFGIKMLRMKFLNDFLCVTFKAYTH